MRTAFGKSVILVFAGALFLNGCVIGITGAPKPAPFKAGDKPAYGKLTYWVEGVSLSGGYLTIRDAIKNSPIFTSVEWREERPKKGVYLHVRVKPRPPSVPALVFGYISLGTLTLTPVWSTKGGADLFYDLHVDGNLVRTYNYHLNRVGIIWIVMLPLIWANLFTKGEGGAFGATYLQFLHDAKPQLDKAWR